jgi:calcineurin-like phosphoesterase family protein
MKYIYVNKIKNQFMKSVIAFSMMTILLLLSVTVLGHNASTQIAHAQTSSTGATLPEFNFATVGDWDCNSRAEKTAENIQARNPELVLGLGDYVYGEDSADCWLEIVEPIDDNMKIVIANHETKSPSLLNQYMSHFALPEQYYSFDYQNVHFTVMADELPREKGSEQYIFVQNDLAKAAADPNIDWIIVAHHSQKYASTKNYIVQNNDKWKDTYHPLFEQYNVDLVLQGHHHSYQRTFPIKFNSGTPIGTPLDAMITDKNESNNYTNPEGQIFITVGTGGASLFPFKGKPPYMASQYKGYGFLNVDIINSNNGQTKLVGTFYPNDGGGEIIDQFAITK